MMIQFGNSYFFHAAKDFLIKWMFFRHPKLSGYYFDYVYIMSNDFQINKIFNPMQVIKDNLLTIL